LDDLPNTASPAIGKVLPLKLDSVGLVSSCACLHARAQELRDSDRVPAATEAVHLITRGLWFYLKAESVDQSR